MSIFVLNNPGKGTYKVVPELSKARSDGETALPLPPKTVPYESEYEAARREAHRSGEGPLLVPKMDYTEQ